jgi:hypothetical protein
MRASLRRLLIVLNSLDIAVNQCVIGFIIGYNMQILSTPTDKI